MSSALVPSYFPSFMWKFWLSTRYCEIRPVYHESTEDVSIFQDLNINELYVDARRLLQEANHAFSRLELVTQSALNDILDRGLRSQGRNDMNQTSMAFSRVSVMALRKYFVFLRFRNGPGYKKTLQSLADSCQEPTLSQFLITQDRLCCVLLEFIRFFDYGTDDDFPATWLRKQNTGVAAMDDFLKLMEEYCWRFCEAEICIGIATEEQEFILSERCYGTLDEGFEEDSSSSDLFFPIVPTLALYILRGVDPNDTPSTRKQLNRYVWLDFGLESASDVHLRNATILQTYPQYLYFQSLRTVALSISSYEEFRSTPEHVDYSRLRQRCRQKFLQETVTKTLTVKGSLTLTDLTDEVLVMGDSAVAYGAFSDVWRGKWEDPVEKRTRVVALKYLRQVMVKGVREKLLNRLQAECSAWHRLCHRNINQLYGIVQSPHSIAMVSQWCENGTVSHYLNNHPDANRLTLLVQVASGIAYLHHINIIHGDLKGGNILVDEHGNATITDFGLSKVMEEITDATMGNSFFAGSTRWMAPELIFALVHDDGRLPPITTFSDVYAFASVCLEVASGDLPYPNRFNDHAVIVDILRGIRPCRSSSCLLKLSNDGEQAFWNMLDQCWGVDPGLRPTMPHMLSFFEVLRAARR